MNNTELLKVFDNNLLDTGINLSDYEIVVFYSGGKDSSILLDLLAKSSLVDNSKLSGLMVEYPISVYSSNDEINSLKEFWEQRDVKINSIKIDPKNDEIKTDDHKCNYCEDLVRNEFIKWLKTKESDKVLIMLGSNVWDIAAFIFHLNFISVNRSLFPNSHLDETKILMSKRCYPVVDFNDSGTIKIIRPMLNISQLDIVEYVKRNNVNILTTPCPYKKGLHKRIFFQYFENLGLVDIDYETVMKFARSNDLLLSPEDYTNLPLRSKIF